MKGVYIYPVAGSIPYDDEVSQLGADNLQGAVEALKSLSDGQTQATLDLEDIVEQNTQDIADLEDIVELLVTPSPSDFIFEGGITVNQDSSFLANMKGVSVRANRDVYLDITGSFTVNIDSSVTAGPNSSVSVKGL